MSKISTKELNREAHFLCGMCQFIRNKPKKYLLLVKQKRSRLKIKSLENKSKIIFKAECGKKLMHKSKRQNKKNIDNKSQGKRLNSRINTLERKSQQLALAYLMSSI